MKSPGASGEEPIKWETRVQMRKMLTDSRTQFREGGQGEGDSGWAAFLCIWSWVCTKRELNLKEGIYPVSKTPGAKGNLACGTCLEREEDGHGVAPVPSLYSVSSGEHHGPQNQPAGSAL